MVGAGAIGCEMMKIFALLGMGTRGDGHLFLTDMDAIERSNLNRQFLFRARDLDRPKADVVAEQAVVLNPELAGRVTAYRTRVSPESESIFGDAFFSQLTGVCNALDNLEARLYWTLAACTMGCPCWSPGRTGPRGTRRSLCRT